MLRLALTVGIRRYENERFNQGLAQAVKENMKGRRQS